MCRRSSPWGGCRGPAATASLSRSSAAMRLSRAAMTLGIDGSMMCSSSCETCRSMRSSSLLRHLRRDLPQPRQAIDTGILMMAVSAARVDNGRDRPAIRPGEGSIGAWIDRRSRVAVRTVPSELALSLTCCDYGAGEVWYPSRSRSSRAALAAGRRSCRECAVLQQLSARNEPNRWSPPPSAYPWARVSHSFRR